ncbi:MAG: phenylacetyl-CoA:acceptor oxidoreductase [Gammaproteobacteria bacterium]
MKFGSQLQTNWDWRAACNFMFGGTGSGLLIAMIVFSYPATTPIWLAFLGLAFVGFGLFMVWLEIGRPWRFLHVFYHTNTSWMTREAAVSMLLFPVAIAGVILQSTPLLGVAALLAAMFLYCQGRILKAAAGVPAWREPAIVPLIVLCGLTEGCAIAMTYAYSMNAEASWMTPVLLFLLGIRLLIWLAYRDAMTRAGAPAKALDVLATLHREFLILGCIVPAVFLLVAMFGSFEALGIYLASIVLIIASWRLKFGLIIKASYKQGYGIGALRRGRPKFTPPVRRAGDPMRY